MMFLLLCGKIAIQAKEGGASWQKDAGLLPRIVNKGNHRSSSFFKKR